MIILAKGKENVIFLKVNAVENLTGFSAVLAACGTSKTLASLTDSVLQFEFSSEEVAKVSEAIEGEFGTLMIYAPDGECRIKARPQFRLMDIGSRATPDTDRTIYISLPKQIDIQGGGGGDTPIDPSVYATKQELKKATAANKQYVDNCVEEIHNTIDEATSHTATWEVKDEDEDGQPDEETLYFHRKDK